MDTPRIFVSHSHQDDEFGVRLVSALRARLGEDAVWYDSSGGLHGGDEWWNRIVAEITSRDVFVVIFSPNSVDSKWVTDEINIAWALRHRIGTRIVPVLYQPCNLRADWLLLQSVSFVAPRPFETALADLFQVLDVPFDQLAQPVSVSNMNISPLVPVIERLTQEIHAAFGQEDWAIVISKANLLLAEAKEMAPTLWRELGLAYVAIGDGAAAVPALDEALKADQYDVSTLRGKGLALALLGNQSDAIPLLDRAYTLAPFTDISLRLTLLGDLHTILTSAQRWNDALRRVQDALRLVPGDGEWLERQLDMLGCCGRDDDAFRLATDLVSSQSAIVQRWVGKRLEYDQENVNLGDALRVVDLGLEVAPADGALLTTKLNLLTQTGREGEALTTAVALAAANSTAVDSWLRARFAAYRQSGDWGRALAVADTALQAQLPDAIWPASKVEALRSMGRLEDAFNFALDITRQPGYQQEVEAWIALAAAAAAINHETEVRRAIKNASELNGDDYPAVILARQQYLEPFERAAEQRARETEALRAKEVLRRKTRKQNISIVALVVSVVLLGCLAVSLTAAITIRTQQAEATQTAAAGTAYVVQAVATQKATIQSEVKCIQDGDTSGVCAQVYKTASEYTTIAPGQCDKGPAVWTISTNPSVTDTCASGKVKVSIPPTSYLGELSFKPAIVRISTNYETSITISNLTSTTDCAGIITNEQSGQNGGYGFWVCGDGSCSANRYDSSGSVHIELDVGLCAGGASTYYLSASTVGDAHILSVEADGKSYREIFFDSTYPSTASISLAIENEDNHAPASATMSYFSYLPLA
jgi:tetratricopeptide (TPR) repeat protein